MSTTNLLSPQTKQLIRKAPDDGHHDNEPPKKRAHSHGEPADGHSASTKSGEASAEEAEHQEESNLGEEFNDEHELKKLEAALTDSDDVGTEDDEVSFNMWKEDEERLGNLMMIMEISGTSRPPAPIQDLVQKLSSYHCAKNVEEFLTQRKQTTNKIGDEDKLIDQWLRIIQTQKSVGVSEAECCHCDPGSGLSTGDIQESWTAYALAHRAFKRHTIYGNDTRLAFAIRNLLETVFQLDQGTVEVEYDVSVIVPQFWGASRRTHAAADGVILLQPSTDLYMEAIRTLQRRQQSGALADALSFTNTYPTKRRSISFLGLACEFTFRSYSPKTRVVIDLAAAQYQRRAAQLSDEPPFGFYLSRSMLFLSVSYWMHEALMIAEIKRLLPSDTNQFIQFCSFLTHLRCHIKNKLLPEINAIEIEAIIQDLPKHKWFPMQTRLSSDSV